MEANLLVGSWRLVSWENRDADGTVSYPMGRDVQGYIMYNPDGYMSVIITGPDRPAFRDADLGGGTDEERARAAATCIAYCGRYELQAGRVVHYVELSLFPNWVGTTQERFLESRRLNIDLEHSPGAVRRPATQGIPGLGAGVAHNSTEDLCKGAQGAHPAVGSSVFPETQ